MVVNSKKWKCVFFADLYFFHKGQNSTISMHTVQKTLIGRSVIERIIFGKYCFRYDRRGPKEGNMMLRGCQKQMIVLQTPESGVFESAFFVLRRENLSVGHDDMIAEANRIIGNGVGVRRRVRHLPERLLIFLLGVALGVGVFALICFLR